ncbi:aldo/keto reductase family oxidoreductase [Novosphingobium sp. Gsoil 351]|uniref:aldo/keto reductase n=1 Tax=Novosphingobium sp. Gsoil 351 TaxID=2675225 RepID=UPI0012B447C8|nr:aldo/keto reductase [Novosphingobium sp. Gsoil 351]QGN53849.1 aldo/keto reductase [Novosphingobium sp. Gsoil 351]
MSELPAPHKVRIGLQGPEIAPIAWGMWRFAGRSRAEGAALVHAALDAGIDLFDTADIYGFDGSGGFGDAEALLGEVLTAEPGLRSRMVLASKGGIRPPLPYDQSPAYLAEAIDASLRRLKVERIDLWQIHRPDILAHPQEVAKALDQARTAGKIGEVGVSNFTQIQIGALAAFLDRPLAATQPEISPLRIEPIENGELDQAMVLGLVPLAWSPLGGGRLADPQDARAKAVAAALDAVGRDRGVSRTVAAYSWLMAHPAGIVPIVGSQQAERIAEAAQALAVRWTREEWYAVLVAARGEGLP